MRRRGLAPARVIVYNTFVMDDFSLALPPLPDDPAALKQIIGQRDARIAELTRERDAKVAELELEKLRLAHQLELLKKRCYGPRADRVDLGQLLLEFAQELESRPVNPLDLPAGTPPREAEAQALRRVKHGRRKLAELENLPVVRQVHDLPEDQRLCPQGHTLNRIGEEITWQVEFAPGFFYRVQHVQIKYACRQCEQQGQDPAITLAAKPAQPIERGDGRAGPAGLRHHVQVRRLPAAVPPAEYLRPQRL